jgi:hypothetical protein
VTEKREGEREREREREKRQREEAVYGGIVNNHMFTVG